MNRWNVDMVSDPSKYLLLIVGFYQRSVLLFLHEFQCCFNLKDLPIGKIVSCCICAAGECFRFTGRSGSLAGGVEHRLRDPMLHLEDLGLEILCGCVGICAHVVGRLDYI